MTFVIEMSEPDKMVDARNLKGHVLRLQAQNLRQVIDAPKTMTEANDFGLRIFAPQHGNARQNRIGHHQVQGIWANLQNILGDGFKPAQLIKIDPERLVMHDVIAAAKAIAMLLRNR